VRVNRLRRSAVTKLVVDKHPALCVALLALELSACGLMRPAHGDSGRRIQNLAGGISMVAPPEWHLASPLDQEANLARFELDEQARETLRVGLRRPGFMLTKYPMPHGSVNPSIGVSVMPRPATDETPEQWLRQLASWNARTALDFTIVDEVRATEVSGVPAAYMRATYRRPLRAGEPVAMQARVWLVPRPGGIVLIVMSGALSGPDEEEETFRAAFDTIEIGE
jgi:hypothetical protein